MTTSSVLYPTKNDKTNSTNNKLFFASLSKSWTNLNSSRARGIGLSCTEFESDFCELEKAKELDNRYDVNPFLSLSVSSPQREQCHPGEDIVFDFHSNNQSEHDEEEEDDDNDEQEDDKDDAVENKHPGLDEIVSPAWTTKVAYTMTTDNPFLSRSISPIPILKSDESTKYDKDNDRDDNSISLPLFNTAHDASDDHSFATSVDIYPDLGSYEFCRDDSDDVSSVSLDSLRRHNPYWNPDMEQTWNPSPPLIIIVPAKGDTNKADSNPDKLSPSSEATFESKLMKQASVGNSTRIEDAILPDWELSWLHGLQATPDLENPASALETSNINNKYTLASIELKDETDESSTGNRSLFARFDKKEKSLILQTTATSTKKVYLKLSTLYLQKKDRAITLNSGTGSEHFSKKYSLSPPPQLNNNHQSPGFRVKPKFSLEGQEDDSICEQNDLGWRTRGLELQEPLRLHWLGRSKSAPVSPFSTIGSKPSPTAISKNAATTGLQATQSAVSDLPIITLNEDMASLFKKHEVDTTVKDNTSSVSPTNFVCCDTLDIQQTPKRNKLHSKPLFSRHNRIRSAGSNTKYLTSVIRRSGGASSLSKSPGGISNGTSMRPVVHTSGTNMSSQQQFNGELSPSSKLIKVRSFPSTASPHAKGATDQITSSHSSTKKYSGMDSREPNQKPRQHQSKFFKDHTRRQDDNDIVENIGDATMTSTKEGPVRLWTRARQSLVSPRRFNTYRLNHVSKKIDRDSLALSALL